MLGKKWFFFPQRLVGKAQLTLPKLILLPGGLYL